MQNINWDHIHVFWEVVCSSTISEAAIKLGINHTTVSRRITSLENQLDSLLFERSGNNWTLTSAGRIVAMHAEAMSKNAGMINQKISIEKNELRGEIRVTLPNCIEHLVIPVIHDFIKEHPDIDIDVLMCVDEVDLDSRKADVAIRVTKQPQPNLIGTYISDVSLAVYGTQTLKRLFDNDALADIPCIIWRNACDNRPSWVEKDFSDSKKIYWADSWSSMLAMVRGGIGLAQLPCALGNADPLLHRITDNNHDSGLELWVLSHTDLRTTFRFKVFRDYIADNLKTIKHELIGTPPQLVS